MIAYFIKQCSIIFKKGESHECFLAVCCYIHVVWTFCVPSIKTHEYCELSKVHLAQSPTTSCFRDKIKSNRRLKFRSTRERINRTTLAKHKESHKRHPCGNREPNASCVTVPLLRTYEHQYAGRRARHHATMPQL